MANNQLGIGNIDNWQHFHTGNISPNGRPYGEPPSWRRTGTTGVSPVAADSVRSASGAYQFGSDKRGVP